jgi:hypothetical protein
VIWAVWISLALLVVVLAAGTWHVVTTGLETWRTFKRFTAVLGHAGDLITARLDELARKAETTGEQAERISASSRHLARSLAYMRIVADAAGDVRAAVTGLRGSVPRK